MYEYFEDAIETEARDLEHEVLFPSKTTFKGRRWAEWDEKSREKTIKNCESRLVITHNDADGLVSGALFNDFFDKVDIVTIDYENIESTFRHLSDNMEDISEVYVSDLNLDETHSVTGEVADKCSSFVWIDHHEWGEKEQETRNMGVDMNIDETRCAAGLVYEYLVDRGYEPTDTAKEIVDITEDHDLWEHDLETIQLGSNEVCISRVFSNLAFFSDTDDFLDDVLDYGRDFLDYEEELLRDGKGEGFLAEKEAKHIMKVEYIINNETTVEEIEGYTVAFAHGRASPGYILEELQERYNIDILAHTKPAYPVKASIRSEGEFNRCHEIAEVLGGGGHEHAAGCKPEVAQEPMEFLNYVTSRGEPLKDEIRDVLEDELKS
jgi:oligoribonuclease NrnB/cAMP/cGMP phosphodiesterase (DHH superfamily)